MVPEITGGGKLRLYGPECCIQYPHLMAGRGINLLPKDNLLQEFAKDNGFQLLHYPLVNSRSKVSITKHFRDGVVLPATSASERTQPALLPAAPSFWNQRRPGKEEEADTPLLVLRSTSCQTAVPTSRNCTSCKHGQLLWTCGPRAPTGFSWASRVGALFRHSQAKTHRHA